MALNKSFKDFEMRKIREATRKAMEEMAAGTVQLLQQKGPYWDGYFANAWEVKQGDVDIPATTTGKSYYDLDEAEQRRGPEPEDNRVYTAPIVPPADLRKGYTIGNSMEYRAIAMDLEDGRLKKGPGTAERDWYAKLVEGGELIRINKRFVEDSFKEEFK
jgi:hypothetical protein